VPSASAGRTRDDDLVGLERCESVADREVDVGLAGNGLNRLARKLLGGAFRDPLRTTVRLFVVREPVEYSLPHNGHHDLDRVCLADVRAQNVVCMFDGADDEDVPAHDDNVPPAELLRRPSQPTRYQS
jgi:hypothetical protein